MIVETRQCDLQNEKTLTRLKNQLKINNLKMVETFQLHH